VCNVASQAGETDGFSCGDHVKAIEKHIGSRIFDLLVLNRYNSELMSDDIEWTRVNDNLGEEYSIYQADLIDAENPRRHDSIKLAQVIMDLFFERTGPLISHENGETF
jgi:2-phospho-L-lactate transferase/gluconeogenesis factor (CofD/UPF0052 family)